MQALQLLSRLHIRPVNRPPRAVMFFAGQKKRQHAQAVAGNVIFSFLSRENSKFYI